MAAATSGIAPLLHPSTLPNLKGDFPPVSCRLWRGATTYESFTLEPYPFDTLNTLKQMIYADRGYDSAYLPRFLFVGIRLRSENTESYAPLDYFWFPIGSDNPTDALTLRHPLDTLAHPDTRFVTAEGALTGVSNESRGRVLMEELLKSSETLELDVFPLSTLLRSYAGEKNPVSQDVWNGRFAPYFPEVLPEGPYRPTQEDQAYGRTLQDYLRLRQQSLAHIEDLFSEQPERPPIDLTGIRQLRLDWKYHIDGFEGAAPLFYRLPVTPTRPFLRLLPSEGTPVTKLHVQGIIPLPTLEDPRVLDGWGKEQNQTPGYDSLMIKYVHRPSSGSTQPLYGTVEVFHQGTMRLTVQPPKTVRKMDPVVDFRMFRQTAAEVFRGLPQRFEAAQLREASVQFTVRLTMDQKKFTTARLLQRLPFFAPFFTQITPPSEESPLIALRYKAVNQYVTENKVFSFITQRITQQRIEDRDVALIEGLQKEFQMTPSEAEKEIADWYEREGKLSVTLPEEDEFVDRFHPGIDLYIYSNHPLYTVIVNRVDSYTSYERIYTLLGLLFLHDDTYFEVGNVDVMMSAEMVVERDAMKREAPRAPAQASAPPSSSSSGLASAPNPASWYIKRLQAMDKALFNPTSASDSGARGYTSQCQSSNNRQPVVLTSDQYERMRMVYEEDPIYWIVYPLEGARDPVKPLGATLTLTIMRYGSDSDHMFYYFCPEYFCLQDDIMVLPQDFEATHDRQGNPKPANSCPFCHGGLIVHGARSGQKGRTVMRRRRFVGEKYHEYVSFLKRGTSTGLFMPCCFLSQSALRMDDPKFDHLRAALQQKKISELQAARAAPLDDSDAEELEQEEFAEEEAAERGSALAERGSERASPLWEVVEETQQLLYRAKETIEYAVLLEMIHREYILEANKTPAAGKFAMAPAAFDTYFRQNSAENLISRTLLHPKLRPTAQGFLRIGVENTYNESLLGALAPILYRTSVAEVKQRILEVIVPRVFLNAHFGNLVLEFFQPADNTAMPITDQELRIWSQTNLQVALTSENHYALLRIYNAYHRFVRFIEDPKQRKDLRHIQPLLSEPGLFTVQGIQLIILNDNGQKPPTVQCPVFGVSGERNKRNDIVFLSRNLRTMGTSQNPYAHYELYIHTSNRPGLGKEVEVHETILRWDYASQRIWPEVVQQRVKEYFSQCHSRYESIYTAQPMGNAAILPLSKALESAPKRPEGILKDSYNHTVGLTFRSRPGSTNLVVVPVVDDGVVSAALSVQNIYLDREDIRAAPVEEVIKYYQYLAPMFLLFPDYTVEKIVRYRQQVAAVQLKNGMYVPASPSKNADQLPSLPVVDVEEFPWDVEERMLEAEATACGKDPEMVRDMTTKDMEEMYQQFRMMVSNWIASGPNTAAIRRDIEAILFKVGLPEYERRKRMWLYLSSTLLSWFDADANYEDRQVDSFMRKDCRVIDVEDACTGSCKWSSESKQCRLHVPLKSEISSGREVSTPIMFTRRVIDELVRFPARRRQLMERGVSSVIKIVEPIRQGDQYVIPESSPSWTTLLRMEWLKKVPEKHQYYEEWSRSETEEISSPKIGSQVDSEWFEDAPYHVLWLENGLVTLTSVLGVTLEDLKMEDRFGRDQLLQYVRLKGAALGIIEGDTVKFVKPIGFMSDVTLLILEGDKVGLVIEEEGKSTISTERLPPKLAERWVEASLVIPKRKPVAVLEGEILRVPLVAKQKIPDAVMQTLLPLRPAPVSKLPAAPAAPVAPAPLAAPIPLEAEKGSIVSFREPMASMAPLAPKKRSMPAPPLPPVVSSSSATPMGPLAPRKRSVPMTPLPPSIVTPQVSVPVPSVSIPVAPVNIPVAPVSVPVSSVTVPSERGPAPPSSRLPRSIESQRLPPPPSRRIPSVASRPPPPPSVAPSASTAM